MSNTLIETVKTQLTKRAEAGVLSNDELIHILDIESRQSIISQAQDSNPIEPVILNQVQQEPLPSQEKCGEMFKEALEETRELSAPQVPEQDEVEEKPLSPTDQKKKEISEEIIALGGTPPEKGALKKFQKALEDLKASQEEEDETPEESTEDTEGVEETEDTEGVEETQDEEEDDIDAFNDLMTEIQELFDRLEEEEKIEDMEVVTEITQGINKDAQSPDELSFAELKKFHAELKKFDK